MAHSVYKLNLSRQDLIRPDLNDQYRQLCSPQTPMSKFLFEDDQPKAVKEISETSKVSQRVSYPNHGTYSKHGSNDFKRNFNITFVCLVSKEAICSPMSVKERTALANAGLEDASITFGLNKSSIYDIMKRFPQRGSQEDAGFQRILPPHTPIRLEKSVARGRVTYHLSSRTLKLMTHVQKTENKLNTI